MSAGTKQLKSKADRKHTVPRRLLTYPQYAAELGVSVDTIRRKVQRGELEVVHISPKHVRIVETRI
jgi:excisionase family DNA binding protein